MFLQPLKKVVRIHFFQAISVGSGEFLYDFFYHSEPKRWRLATEKDLKCAPLVWRSPSPVFCPPSFINNSKNTTQIIFTQKKNITETGLEIILSPVFMYPVLFGNRRSPLRTAAVAKLNYFCPGMPCKIHFSDIPRSHGIKNRLREIYCGGIYCFIAFSRLSFRSCIAAIKIAPMRKNSQLKFEKLSIGCLGVSVSGPAMIE